MQCNDDRAWFGLIPSFRAGNIYKHTSDNAKVYDAVRDVPLQLLRCLARTYYPWQASIVNTAQVNTAK